MSRSGRPVGWALGGLMVLVLSVPLPNAALAQIKGQGAISVFITYRFKAENRAAVREAMVTAAAPQFEKWKSEGVFKDYLILFPSYVHMNSAPWEMLVILDFDRYADTDNWKKVERTAPGGLPPKALALASPESTYLSEVLEQNGLHSGEPGKSVYSVSPYKFKTGPAAGKPFVSAYVLPQLAPFVRDKILSGYGLYMNLHDLSDWSYLLISEYADTAAFGVRNKAASRTSLTENSAWRSLHEMKPEIREELPAFFTERILPR
jgi:hypothetical protein